MVAIHVYCFVQKLIHSVFKWKHIDQGFFWITLEQSLLFHLTCSIAHSCCSRTLLRKLLHFRKCLKNFAEYFILLHFILKLRFILKLLKKRNIHNWKLNSCIKKTCFFLHDGLDFSWKYRLLLWIFSRMTH